MVNEMRIVMEDVPVIIRRPKPHSTPITFRQLEVIMRSSKKPTRSLDRFNSLRDILFDNWIELVDRKKPPVPTTTVKKNESRIDEEAYVLAITPSGRRRCFRLFFERGQFDFEECPCPKHLRGEYIDCN